MQNFIFVHRFSRVGVGRTFTLDFPVVQFLGEALVEAEKVSRHRVLLVAAADTCEGLPPSIRRCFSHEISMNPLSEAQRLEMLSQSLQSFSEVTCVSESNMILSFIWI